MSLAADQVSLRIGRRALLESVSLRVEAGKVHALLGPNGAGKTTLLRLLSGECGPQSGAVRLEERCLTRWSAADLSRHRAVVSQSDSLSFPMQAEEMVALGRLPHGPESSANEARIVRSALEICSATAFSGRCYLTLSGGERSRVRLARAMAQVWEQFDNPDPQHPRYLLLDEPAAHLDIGHQHFAMQVLRAFANAGGGVLVTLHDPNLALAYCDIASIVAGGRLIASGVVNDVLVPEVLAPVYGLEVQRLSSAAGMPLLCWSSAAGSSSRS